MISVETARKKRCSVSTSRGQGTPQERTSGATTRVVVVVGVVVVVVVVVIGIVAVAVEDDF